MVSKWKRLAVDIIIVLITSTIIAFSVNEIRKSKISLLPPHLYNSQYKEMKLSTFQQGDRKNSRCFIFDARPHELYQKNHLEGALNFPVTQFDFFYHFHLADEPLDVPIFVHGRTVSKAFDRELAYCLSSVGYKNITVLY